MRILIDIGHPAHIHYFKNMAKILSAKGYEFFFTVREREATMELIEKTGFPYVSRGKGSNDAIRKFISMFKNDAILLKHARRFNPDLFMSFSSPYAAQVAWLTGKPHIALDDTEHAKMQQRLYRPFTKHIISPSVYCGKILPNQHLVNSYLELCYLHPNYFTPNKEIFNELNLNEGERYVILRFVSWNAAHDVGQKGFSYKEKLKLVHALEEKCRVFISSEQDLPEELKKYKLPTHPSKFHDVIAFASAVIGEGATTASESAVLGVPAIYTNPLHLSYCDEEEQKYGLLYQLYDCNSIINKALGILKKDKQTYIKRRQILLKEKEDFTSYLVSFVENLK